VQQERETTDVLFLDPVLLEELRQWDVGPMTEAFDEAVNLDRGRQRVRQLITQRAAPSRILCGDGFVAFFLIDSVDLKERSPWVRARVLFTSKGPAGRPHPPIAMVLLCPPKQANVSH
jgi:hypothetical protein